MAYAVFRCCVTANHLPAFDDAVDELTKKLGVPAGEIPAFGCCGYPLKNIDMTASLASSARNLALAEAAGMDILTACACCYGTLLQASKALLQDKELKEKINAILDQEGLAYEGTVQVKHLFHVLMDDVGIEKIAAQKVSAPALKKVALQYGCKLLRPGLSAQFTPPREEHFFEELAKAVGAELVPWGQEKDCCGSGIAAIDPAMAEEISRKKMSEAESADGVVAACPFCVIQLGKNAQNVEVTSAAELLCSALK